MLSRYLQREAIFVGRSFLYEEEDCKSAEENAQAEQTESYIEEKCEEEEEKLCEEFEAQASVFCKSVESRSSVKGETSL